MRRWRALLVLVTLWGAWGAAKTMADEENPHWMLRPDGEPDEEKCAICHDEDMNLLSSKEETCLSCHDRTLHSGSAEHLAVAPERVAAVLPPPTPNQEEPLFPLAEDGRMYCGSCHLFHDPRVAEETLASVRELPSHALAQAVRRAILQRCENLFGSPTRAQVSFAPQSTGFLRLPIHKDELCVACHRLEELR